MEYGLMHIYPAAGADVPALAVRPTQRTTKNAVPLHQRRSRQCRLEPMLPTAHTRSQRSLPKGVPNQCRSSPHKYNSYTSTINSYRRGGQHLLLPPRFRLMVHWETLVHVRYTFIRLPTGVDNGPFHQFIYSSAYITTKCEPRISLTSRVEKRYRATC